MTATPPPNSPPVGATQAPAAPAAPPPVVQSAEELARSLLEREGAVALGVPAARPAAPVAESGGAPTPSAGPVPVPPTALAVKSVIARGLRNLAHVVHADQVRAGYWPKGVLGAGYDCGSFFSDLHSKISNAYETYIEEPNPRKIVWIDPQTGAETSPGKGFPQGMAVDLVMILFGLVGFSDAIGIDLGVMAADMAVPVGVPVGVPEPTVEGSEDDDFWGTEDDDVGDFEVAGEGEEEVEGDAELENLFNEE